MAAVEIPKGKVYDSIIEVLQRHTSKNIAVMLLSSSLLRKGLARDLLEQRGIDREFVQTMKIGIDLFLQSENDKKNCVAALNNMTLKNNGKSVVVNSGSISELRPVRPAPATPKSAYDSMIDILTDYIPRPLAVGFVDPILSNLGIDKCILGQKSTLPAKLGKLLESNLLNLLADESKKIECRKRLYSLLDIGNDAGSEVSAVSIPIVCESDIVIARNQAHNIANSIGFDKSHQIKIATAVSELSRNIVRYVGKGKINISVLKEPFEGIEIIASDKGSGIDDLEEILVGQYKSKTGLGLGIWSCKKLMDYFDIKTSSIGTTVTIRKYQRALD